MNDRSCEREDDLLSYLYGELNEHEVPAFERHLQNCDGCSSDFAGFKNVRQSVVAWRDESLGRVSQSPQADFVTAPQRRRSAAAALREFFNLSPIWLKGAVAFASVLFCLLAGLTIVRWNENKTATPVVVQNGYSQTAVDKLVAQAREDERNKFGAQSQVAIAVEPTNTNEKTVTHRPVRTNHASQEFAKRPLSRTEREQLAADLRLITTGDSDTELLNDSLNQ